MASLPAVLQELVKNAELLLKHLPDVDWIDDIATPEDIRAMEAEVKTADPFDKFQLKANLWTSKDSVLRVKSCKYAKVLYLKPSAASMPINWKLWGRIFQWFSIGQPVRVFFFMSPVPRILPSPGQPVESQHINGGYTYPCHTNGITIFRYEEATRVLIHELLHAACTDNMRLPTELRETKTEVWAELVYIAILSKGSLRRAAHLWKIQKQWIVDANTTLRRAHGVRSYSDYAYRYTVGREEELKLHGIDLSDCQPSKTLVKSGRFTSPQLDL